MAGLKPNEEIMAASFSVAAVYAVFQTHAPNMADVKAAPSNNPNTHRSVKSAVITSAVLITGMALLAKSPTVYVVGGLATVVEGWQYYHANALSMSNGTPTTQQGQ